MEKSFVLIISYQYELVKKIKILTKYDVDDVNGRL